MNQEELKQIGQMMKLRQQLDPDAPKTVIATDQQLYEAIVTRATDRINTKHDPYCDCGICQYCRGDEDKFGNPTAGQGIEIGRLRREIEILAAIACSECDASKTDAMYYNVDWPGFRLQFAKEAWKYGWIVEAGKVLCPNCRADAEEWRSI